MARRRLRGHHGDDKGQLKGFADRIATATKPDPGRVVEPGDAPSVLGQGLTRYQRRTANLPSGAVPMTDAERTNIVIDLRNSGAEDDE